MNEYLILPDVSIEMMIIKAFILCSTSMLNDTD